MATAVATALPRPSLAAALPPSTTLQRREIEVIADYLTAKVIGRGEITRDECVEAFGSRGGSCEEYPAKP